LMLQRQAGEVLLQSFGDLRHLKQIMHPLDQSVQPRPASVASTSGKARVVDVWPQ
jgi:hypothetical protein